MPPPNKTATTSNHLLFDPWNSASSGHQRSESNPGTAWQRTREAKLAQQFRSGDCTINSFVYNGVNRVYEKGEWEWDWDGDARGERGGDGRGGKRAGRGRTVVSKDSKQRDIRSMMGVGKGGPSSGSGLAVGEKMNMMATTTSTPPPTTQMPTPPYEATFNLTDLTPGAFSGTVLSIPDPVPLQHQHPSGSQSTAPTSTTPESTILHGVTTYINGKTAPLVSDHKLKSLLVAHGATLALSFSRRVTHIIIGKPNAGPGHGGAGGGLAAGKIQKEMARGGWRGMRIVGVEWVLESIKAGKRLPETRFAVNLGSQRSVLGFM